MRSPIRSILAATDLESGSDAVVRSAATLAQRAGAELHLLHSLELPWAPADDEVRRTGFLGRIQRAEEKLQEQVDRTMPEGVRPTTQKVIIYIARKAILDWAQELSADLIVMGPHRGGAAGALFLGTTADRVLRTAEVPCLIIVEPLRDDVRSIGVPVDFSAPSRLALITAAEWALGLGSGGRPALRMMHVAPPADFGDPALTEEAARVELDRFVSNALSEVAEGDSLEIHSEVRRAWSPANEIVGWLRSSEVDLLAMGTHGHGGLRRALIGSVASSIARQSPVPVLLVPPALREAADGAAG